MMAAHMSAPHTPTVSQLTFLCKAREGNPLRERLFFHDTGSTLAGLTLATSLGFNVSVICAVNSLNGASAAWSGVSHKSNY